MYRQECFEQLKLDISFGIALNKENRWVKLAELFPWSDIEKAYLENFNSQEGQIAKPARLAFGALYIQAAEGYTDEQTRRNIEENPYLQYFCGFETYTQKSPFDASMMTYFRKRISMEMKQEITKTVFCKESCNEQDNEEPNPKVTIYEENAEELIPENSNRGTVILDATCCPSDIRYPTDIGLLNQGRELTEKMIDCLYNPVKCNYEMKPRTYRQAARKEYLAYSKKRSHTQKETRKCVHRQLLYLQRDFGIMEKLLENGAKQKMLDKEYYRKLFGAYPKTILGIGHILSVKTEIGATNTEFAY